MPATVQRWTITEAVASFGPPPSSGDPADIDPTTLTDHHCQVTDAAAVATAKTETQPATLCQPEADIVTDIKWSLRLGALQDWGQADSLSDWAFDNGGKLMAFAIEGLSPAATPRGMKGLAYVIPGDFAGVAGPPLTWSQTWPCSVPPVRYAPAPAALAAQAEPVA
jgi:hypothetical protein